MKKPSVIENWRWILGQPFALLLRFWPISMLPLILLWCAAEVPVGTEHFPGPRGLASAAEWPFLAEHYSESSGGIQIWSVCHPLVVSLPLVTGDCSYCDVLVQQVDHHLWKECDSVLFWMQMHLSHSSQALLVGENTLFFVFLTFCWHS